MHFRKLHYDNLYSEPRMDARYTEPEVHRTPLGSAMALAVFFMPTCDGRQGRAWPGGLEFSDEPPIAQAPLDLKPVSELVVAFMPVCGEDRPAGLKVMLWKDGSLVSGCLNHHATQSPTHKASWQALEPNPTTPAPLHTITLRGAN